METAFKEILKQSNKINRILSKISQKNPHISEEIELALYSVSKIEKSINKFMNKVTVKQEIDVLEDEEKNIPKNHSDPVWENALQNIEGFKNATYKLERKLNILINQVSVQPRAREHRNDQFAIKHSRHKNVNESKGRQKISSEHLFKKGVSKRQSPMIDQLSENLQQSSDVNLSEIDANIMELTKKIRQCVQNGEYLQSNYRVENEQDGEQNESQRQKFNRNSLQFNK